MYITGFRASVIILKTCVGKRIGTSSVKCLAHSNLGVCVCVCLIEMRETL